MGKVLIQVGASEEARLAAKAGADPQLVVLPRSNVPVDEEAVAAEAAAKAEAEAAAQAEADAAAAATTVTEVPAEGAAPAESSMPAPKAAPAPPAPKPEVGNPDTTPLVVSDVATVCQPMHRAPRLAANLLSGTLIHAGKGKVVQGYKLRKTGCHAQHRVVSSGSRGRAVLYQCVDMRAPEQEVEESTEPAPAMRIKGAYVARGDSTYLITGGLGGFGLALAVWLVEHGARKIVLSSKRCPLFWLLLCWPTSVCLRCCHHQAARLAKQRLGHARVPPQTCTSRYLHASTHSNLGPAWLPIRRL